MLECRGDGLQNSEVQAVSAVSWRHSFGPVIYRMQEYKQCLQSAGDIALVL